MGPSVLRRYFLVSDHLKPLKHATTNTFRYVAMHAMTESTSSHVYDEPATNGYIEGPSRKTLSKSDIAITLVGMLVPLLTQIGHVH